MWRKWQEKSSSWPTLMKLSHKFRLCSCVYLQLSLSIALFAPLEDLDGPQALAHARGAPKGEPGASISAQRRRTLSHPRCVPGRRAPREAPRAPAGSTRGFSHSVAAALDAATSSVHAIKGAGCPAAHSQTSARSRSVQPGDPDKPSTARYSFIAARLSSLTAPISLPPVVSFPSKARSRNTPCSRRELSYTCHKAVLQARE